MSCHSQLGAKHAMSQWKIILIDTRLFVRVYFVQEPEQRATTQKVLLTIWNGKCLGVYLICARDKMGLIEDEVG